jgi:hypothetical protein
MRLALWGGSPEPSGAKAPIKANFANRLQRTKETAYNARLTITIDTGRIDAGHRFNSHCSILGYLLCFLLFGPLAWQGQG